jgi:hypothetical protein
VLSPLPISVAGLHIFNVTVVDYFGTGSTAALSVRKAPAGTPDLFIDMPEPVVTESPLALILPAPQLSLCHPVGKGGMP